MVHRRGWRVGENLCGLTTIVSICPELKLSTNIEGFNFTSSRNGRTR